MHGFYYKPSVSKSLADPSKGLIGLPDAWRRGRENLLGGQIDGARDAAAFYRDLLAKEVLSRDTGQGLQEEPASVPSFRLEKRAGACQWWPQ